MIVDVTVKWENREKFILKIQQLDEYTQLGLMNWIENNELLLKLTKEQHSLDEILAKDKDSSIYQILTLNTKSMDNISQNCSFSNIERLNLNLSFNGGNSYMNQSQVDDEGKFAFETKSYEQLIHRVQVLERENKIYKINQNEVAVRNKELSDAIKRLLKDKQKLERSQLSPVSSKSPRNKMSKEALDYISQLEIDLDRIKTELHEYKKKNNILERQLNMYEDQINKSSLQDRLQEIISK